MLDQSLAIAKLQYAGVLGADTLQRLVPSAFAEHASANRSDKYRMVPTSTVLESMVKEGFYPVKAFQTNSRLEERRVTTKHVIRLRHKSVMEKDLAGETPELVLVNSHDGSCAYQLMAGIFRVVCSNGLIVSAADFGTVHVRHAGPEKMVGKILDASFRIIEDSPRVMERVEAFKALRLNRTQQVAFAHEACSLRKTTLTLDAGQLLRPRRKEDAEDADGSRSLWATFNVIQERLINASRMVGVDARGAVRSLRPLNNIQEDLSINKGLWEQAERFAA